MKYTIIEYKAFPTIIQIIPKGRLANNKRRPIGFFINSSLKDMSVLPFAYKIFMLNPFNGKNIYPTQRIRIYGTQGNHLAPIKTSIKGSAQTIRPTNNGYNIKKGTFSSCTY